MTSTPMISVVIPCYNATAYIAETLQSVVDQTFLDWEAIVLDDGSADDTPVVVDSFTRRDGRMRLVRRMNSGVSTTRNTGVAAARGEFIAFLDADDVWHPTYLQRMAMHLASRPDIGISFAIVRIIGGDGKSTGSYGSVKSGNLDTLDFLSSNPTTTCSNLLVRREVFERLGGFREDLCHAEDQLFLIKAHLSSVVIEGFPEILVDYRTNENGLSSDLESMRKGWEFMAAQALTEAPDIIGPLMPRARALNLCYLARRALRVRSASDSWRYMSGALHSDWRILVGRPWPTLPLTAACWLASFACRAKHSLAEKSP
jgi:glycosyltransferase involved in cell wall biosynthesis